MNERLGRRISISQRNSAYYTK